MSESVLQAIFAAGIGVGFVAGLITAVVILLGWFVHTEPVDEGPMQATEDARLHGYGILHRDHDGTLRSLSPTRWAIRRKPGWRE